jgi:hypothetical protein
MIHVSDAGTYRVEGFERANERTGRKHLDLDAAIGRNADRLRKTNCAGVKTRRTFGPVGHHLQLSDSLGDHWGGEARSRAGGQ